MAAVCRNRGVSSQDMPKQAEYSFSIRTPEDLLKKLRGEIITLLKTSNSPEVAINGAFTAWHLKDWVWGLQLKGDDKEQERLFGRTFENVNEFEDYILLKFDFFRVVKDVCNGSKHLGCGTRRRGLKTAPAVTATGMTEGLRAVASWTEEVFTLDPDPIVTLASGETILFRTFLEKAWSFWAGVITGRTKRDW